MRPDWLDDVTSGDEIRAWLTAVWDRTEAAVILAGGEDGGPLAERRVLGEVFDPADLAELRALSTTGTFLDDRCRCHGSLTIALLDTDAEFIGSGSCHGRSDVSWASFGNNLQVDRPERLLGFLERYGAYRR
ncbi:hypothetical protein OG866_13115 [Streptomyces sp. NBC_00663]|uniref:hypothetical protein n=1 Tax=Streptomyces sp. NBC_00663 TaxID=2975801 RepID=UPI002E319A1D|nr:hypothetical protein [Streptomyces sp. NBC_00663]